MNPRTLIGVSLLSGLSVVFFGMQILMVGPLQGRLQNIQARLDQSDRSMNRLVRSSVSAEQTNDLLSSLEQQARGLESLRRSISDIQTLRNTISTEGTAAVDAMQAVDQIAAVQDRLIASSESTTLARESLDALDSLRQTIISGSDATEVVAPVRPRELIDGGLSIDHHRRKVLAQRHPSIGFVHVVTPHADMQHTVCVDADGCVALLHLSHRDALGDVTTRVVLETEATIECRDEAAHRTVGHPVGVVPRPATRHVGPVEHRGVQA